MKIIFTLLLVLGSKFIFSQYGLRVINLSSDCDTVKLKTTVVFEMGSGSNCPTLSGYTVQQHHTTAMVDLFYDISGAWPAHECERENSITFALALQPAYLHIRTNRVFDTDTTFAISDTSVLYCPADTATKSPASSLIIYPNPFSENIYVEIPAVKPVKLTICDQLGRTVMAFDNIEKNKLEISGNHLDRGLYIIYLWNNDKLIATSKMLSLE